MNTETVTITQREEGFEIIIQHDQSGGSYGISLSKDAYEQLQEHFTKPKREKCDNCEEMETVICSKPDKPLTECMVGRDTECNHPKCPVTDEDERNGRYCTLPLFDYRQ